MKFLYIRAKGVTGIYLAHIALEDSENTPCLQFEFSGLFPFMLEIFERIEGRYRKNKSTMLEFLRRFGLQYCDLPTMIDNSAFLFRILSVNIQRSYTKGIPPICYLITFLAFISYFYVYVISMLWFVLVRCRETEDMAAASAVYSLAACSLASILKLLYIRFYNDAIKDIVEEFVAFDALVEAGSRYSTNLLKALKNVKRRAILFYLNEYFDGIMYVMMGIIQPGRHLPADLFELLGLQHSMFETPIYETAFTLMAAGVFCAISAETATGVFITILAGYSEAHILALSEELHNLWEDANVHLRLTKEISEDDDNNINNEIINENIRNNLRDIVIKHIKIIDLIGKIETMFRGAMTIVFACASSGVIAELLGGLENTFLQVPYTLLQVAINCLIGQRLIDASLILEDAVYSCKWENFDTSNQKTVFLMLLNSQKTLTLSIGGLTFLSFESFMAILKSMYSFYTALRSRM